VPLHVNEQPFDAAEQRRTICGTEVVVAPFRPCVWISVTVPWAPPLLPDDAPRFLALLDTGFNGALFLREDHFRRLVGEVAALPERSPGRLRLADDRMETHRRYQAKVWLHGYGLDHSTPAFDLDISRGIVAWSEPPAEEPEVLGETFLARLRTWLGIGTRRPPGVGGAVPVGTQPAQGPPLPVLGAMALWPRKVKVSVDYGTLRTSIWVP
jgi:hypothetical protein